MHIDVFNGDADGICALIQLRLDMPVKSKLITGTKRDIELLDKVIAQPNDFITVLDISLKKNRTALDKHLRNNASVFYIDHHDPGEIPIHSKLNSIINTNPNICTSLLVNSYLAGKYSSWAITAAFGDNLIKTATKLSKQLSLNNKQYQQLKTLGICINYNSYGSHISDLHFSPENLYLTLVNYALPFDFIADNRIVYQQLLVGYKDDLAKAKQISPLYQTDSISVTVLPNEPWARRISGVLSNQLANITPKRAHAIVSNNKEGGYQISVRAPLSKPIGADELCSRFNTGGGRKNAAGINHLPIDDLTLFINALCTKYS